MCEHAKLFVIHRLIRNPCSVNFLFFPNPNLFQIIKRVLHIHSCQTIHVFLHV